MREFDSQSSNTPLFKSMGTFDRNLNWPGKLYYIREFLESKFYTHIYIYSTGLCIYEYPVYLFPRIQLFLYSKKNDYV